MHAVLMEGVRGAQRDPGEFRRVQNWIGPPGCTLEDAVYVPPPPDRLWDCLGAFEKYLHADHDIKQAAIDRLTPPGVQPGRYQPTDALLAFLDRL